MSEMEQDVRKYFWKIAGTITAGILWMIITATAGIMARWAFIYDEIKTGNIVFYAWFLVSFVLLIWFFIRTWRKK
jgi:hypothetical protein